jgi:heavy metal translocating P-type ATPase
LRAHVNRDSRILLKYVKLLLVVLVGSALAGGFATPYLAAGQWQERIWAAAALIVLAFLLADIATSLARREFGLDMIAALSMSVALWFGEYLAAAVVALMYAGGELLEDYAETRARSELKALLGRVPKTALRYVAGGLEETPIGAIAPGDRLLIRQGDVVPVDGEVMGPAVALLDQAVLTGESVPVRRTEGQPVLSGSTSLDMAFDMRAKAGAADSTYAGIVRLVRAAQEAKAPMVRLADRYALWFMALTLVLAAATWFLSGPAVHETRMLAVLISATPCPLILAVPVAIISGISKAAKRGVLVKGGPVLETLARARTLVIDKTGTLTEGRAGLAAILPADGHSADRLLRLAASLEQASGHVVATALVDAARRRGFNLATPQDAQESAGAGISGRVDGHRVLLGGYDFVKEKLAGIALPRPDVEHGQLLVAVAIDHVPAGFIILADALRVDSVSALDRLRAAGISRIVLASGDAAAVVERIAAGLPLDEVRADLTPTAKLAVVRAESATAVTLMAGDGVNDAPALAAADVGISMGARGSAAAAEAADAVLVVDELDRIAEAVAIARRTRAIALESVFVGLGLSLAAMVAAAFGYLKVIEGALFQEVIDVAVILNALRALR